MAVQRTEYRNLSSGTVRAGSTGRGESLVDVENFLMPMEQARSRLHSAGVVEGLRVSVSLGAADVAVSPGTALNADGKAILLPEGGYAVIDPNVGPDAVENVPTVVVGANGVVLPTAGRTGDQILVVSWREVAGPSGTFVRRHAPWLRLESAAGFVESSDAVVLGAVSLDATGLVTQLVAGIRTVAGRLEVRGVTVTDSAVAQARVAELVGSSGGLRLNLLGTSGTTQVLAVDDAGSVMIGNGSGPVSRRLQVEGSEVHTGGAGGGYSFSDRGSAGFVETPSVGERWLWYADGGTARLWSGADLLVVGYDGHLQANALSLPADGTISARGRLHIAGDETLYLLNTNGVVVSRGWGGNGNLSVEGAFQVAGGLTMSAGGTISAPGRLHIAGDEILYLLNRAGVVVSRAWGGNGNVTVEGSAIVGGDQRVAGRLGSGGFDHTAGLPSGWGGGVHTWDVYAEGSVGCGPGGLPGNAVPAGMNRDGVVWGRRKPFIIDHPLDPEHFSLVHAAVEGPEYGVYYRGEAQLVDGTTTVRLPDYFEALVQREGRTVQLTPILRDDEGACALATTPVVEGEFAVRTTDGSKRALGFYWEVRGARADVDDLVPTVAKGDADANPAMLVTN